MGACLRARHHVTLVRRSPQGREGGADFLGAPFWGFGVGSPGRALLRAGPRVGKRMHRRVGMLGGTALQLLNMARHVAWGGCMRRLAGVFWGAVTIHMAAPHRPWVNKQGWAGGVPRAALDAVPGCSAWHLSQGRRTRDPPPNPPTPLARGVCAHQTCSQSPPAGFLFFMRQRVPFACSLAWLAVRGVMNRWAEARAQHTL